LPPVVDYTRCKGAGECVAVCPTNTLEMGAAQKSAPPDVDRQVIVARPENCIECRACEAACPHGAITVP
jgi:NAD-dependent dihydropyrimidine dehydrogenase PreA subunit